MFEQQFRLAQQEPIHSLLVGLFISSLTFQVSLYLATSHNGSIGLGGHVDV